MYYLPHPSHHWNHPAALVGNNRRCTRRPYFRTFRNSTPTRQTPIVDLIRSTVTYCKSCVCVTINEAMRVYIHNLSLSLSFCNSLSVVRIVSEALMRSALLFKSLSNERNGGRREREKGERRDGIRTRCTRCFFDEIIDSTREELGGIRCCCGSS